VFGLTAPLITTHSGEKMGKTAKGAVWLNADRLSPYEYWQFWRNTADADVGRFLRLFTELPLPEITRLESLQSAELNEAKKMLATKATELCHGKKQAAEAEASAASVFERGGVGEALPTLEIARSRLEQGVPAFEILREAGLASSNSEARRLIKAGAARINDVMIEGELQLVGVADLGPNHVIKLSAGKKRHALVKPV
jgi:tyrosyl-tRNA synthetase